MVLTFLVELAVPENIFVMLPRLVGFFVLRQNRLKIPTTLLTVSDRICRYLYFVSSADLSGFVAIFVMSPLCMLALLAHPDVTALVFVMAAMAQVVIVIFFDVLLTRRVISENPILKELTFLWMQIFSERKTLKQ